MQMIRCSVFSLTLLLALLPAGVIHSQGVQESPEKTYQTALQLFQEGLFPEAIPLFRLVTERHENRSLAESAGYYLVLASVEIDSLLLEPKTEWYVSRYPTTRRAGELLRDVGHHYRDRGEYRKALDWFERAVDRPMTRRQRTELLYHMAEAAANDHSYDEARAYFLQVSENQPESVWAPRALYARGRLYLEEERFADSAEAFELLRTRYPDDVMTRRVGTALGESYYLQRRYREAIDALEQAIPDLGGDDLTKAVFLIGESYNMLDELESAQQYYRYYLNRVEDEDQQRAAYYGLGWVYHKQEIYHWSSDAFGRASVGDDELARKALYYKAANEKLSGSYRRALETFREFGERFTEGVFIEEAYYEWAITAVEVGRYVEAIDILLPMARRAETLQNPGPIITLLGEAYYGNAEYTRAIEAFEIADQIAGIDPALKLQARFQRAWVQYSNQAYQQAQPNFQAVYSESPSGSELGGEALFWSADSHFESRNYGPAARQYASFIRQFPNHEMVGAAKYALGWSYFMMGDFREAIDPLRDFMENYEPPSIALYPYDTDVKLRIGDSWFALGEYENAMEYYNMAIGAEPGGDYAMFQVANSYYRMNRNFEAVTEFRRVLRIYPYSSLREQAQYNIAYIYLNTGNYDQAVTEFRTVIERYPNTEWAARSQYNIGDAYYNAEDYQRAIEAYQEVLERYPRSRYVIEAIDGIQFAQLSGGGQDTSTDMLEDFLSENPTSETADRLRFRQAINRYQSGDYEGAVNEFRQYIRITNRQDLLPEAWYNLGESQLRMNQRDEAVESFRRVALDFPSSERAPTALEQLGRLMVQRGDHDQAEEYYRRLQESGSRYREPALLGLGRTALAAGRIDRAREHYETVLESDERNEEANLGIAKIELGQRNHEAARRIARDVAERSTTELGAEAQIVIGRSFQEQRNYEEALQAYARVSVLYEAYTQWVAEARYRTAEIYILQNRRGDAIQLLEEIRTNYSGTPAAERAARLLNRN